MYVSKMLPLHASCHTSTPLHALHVNKDNMAESVAECTQQHSNIAHTPTKYVFAGGGFLLALELAILHFPNERTSHCRKPHMSKTRK